MPAFSFRRFSAAVAAAALVATASPHAAAAPASDETISSEQIGDIPAGFAARKVAIPMACRARSPISVGSTSFTISRIFATAVAPEQSVVGQPQPIRIMVHPLNITVPDVPLGGNFVGASRISIDLRIPDGLTLSNPRVETTPGVVGGFTVFTVNDSGAKDPAGRILRLAGDSNATIGFSPNKSMNSAGGANVPAGEDGMRIVLPSIVADATATSEGAKNISLNTVGAAGNFNDPHNFMTLLIHVTAPVVGDVFVPVMCSPRKDPQSPLHPAAAAVVGLTATNDPSAPAPSDNPDEQQPEENAPDGAEDAEADANRKDEEQPAAEPEETATTQPEAEADQPDQAPASPTSSQAEPDSNSTDGNADTAAENGDKDEETNLSMRLDRIFIVPAVLALLVIGGVVLFIIRRRKHRDQA